MIQLKAKGLESFDSRIRIQDTGYSPKSIILFHAEIVSWEAIKIIPATAAQQIINMLCEQLDFCIISVYYPRVKTTVFMAVGIETGHRTSYDAQVAPILSSINNPS